MRMLSANKSISGDDGRDLHANARYAAYLAAMRCTYILIYVCVSVCLHMYISSYTIGIRGAKRGGMSCTARPRSVSPLVGRLSGKASTNRSCRVH